ncbi:MAG: diaminopimelate epimerase [Clostridia bacterium]|nr:diaminopimelate epimerase [Clostridia bacterium]
MRFTKMHGIGNDYVYIDCVNQQLDNPGELAIKLSDRRFGIGGDGIILICPSETADFRMRMFNADGSEGKMCGNGIRCFSRFVYEKGMTDKTELAIETLAGIKYVTLTVEDGTVTGIRVDMGAPIFASEHIPVLYDGEEMIDKPIAIGGMEFNATCVSMGNPHCVVFVDDVDSFPLEAVGPKFENNKIFPDRVNTEFVRKLDDGSLQMRVWERGSGETWACGTGACAVLAAAVRTGVIEGRSATIHLRGGDLFIEWDEETGSIFMTGGATFVFDGEVEL